MRPLVPIAAPIVAFACLALAACAHVRPADTRLPAAYEAPAAPPAGAIALDRWWLAFNDPQLTTLIDQALTANPDARTAAARLAEARAVRSSALTHFLPQGDISASTRRTDTTQLAGTVFNFPGFSSSGVSETQAANLNVSWEVDIFGRLFTTARTVNADLAAARFDYEGTRASLAANVADAYFLARGLAIQLDDARATARIERELYNVATKRAQVGIGSTADADRVAGDLSRADSQSLALESQLQVQRRTLLVLAGRIVEPTTNVKVDAIAAEVPQVPAALPSDLLKRRPDVREAEARVQGAAGRSQLDLLSFLPTLTFQPGIGWQKQTQPGFTTTVRTLSLGGALAQPLFSIPRLYEDLKAQNARTEQAVIAYEKAVQTAFSESESALVQLDTDRRRVAVLIDGEARARRSYEAARSGYDRGITDLQGVLDAEQSWRLTRTSLTAAQVQALRRAVQAYKALGGGWPADRFPTNAQAR